MKARPTGPAPPFRSRRSSWPGGTPSFSRHRREPSGSPATEGLALLRRTVREEALRAGVPRSVSMDLAFAVNEVVTNAVVYASGVAMVWAWASDGRFTCQFEDAGRGIGDPLAGYRPPTQEAASGRGLWLARQLVDLLQIVPGPTGTTVRLSVCLP